MPANTQLTQNPSFDYDSLAGSLRKEICNEANAIRGLLRQTAESIVQIGLRLQIVRDLLGRGQFQNWLVTEFGWSQPTASRYMRVAALFSDSACIMQFQPSALYLLAQKRVGDSVRKAVFSCAQQGQSVTRTMVEQMLANGEGRTHKRVKSLPDLVRDYLERITRDVEEEFVDELAETLVQMARELKQRNAKAIQ